MVCFHTSFPAIHKIILLNFYHTAINLDKSSLIKLIVIDLLTTVASKE